MSCGCSWLLWLGLVWCGLIDRWFSGFCGLLGIVWVAVGLVLFGLGRCSWVGVFACGGDCTFDLFCGMWVLVGVGLDADGFVGFGYLVIDLLCLLGMFVDG